MTALGDIIVSALKQLLTDLFDPITEVIEKHGSKLVQEVVGTPAPSDVFTQPVNDPWINIYSYYWQDIVPLALLLWALSVGLVIFFESTSHLFSGYHQARLKRRAFTGLVGILGWWWLAALSLRFMDALTGVIVPDLTDISLFETLSFASMSVLGLVLSLSVDLALFVLIALIYLVRQLALYLFVLLMPVLIALWVPGIGPMAFVSGFVKKLAGFYVPFLFMPLPVAVLFRLGEILGSSVGFTDEGILLWLTALVIPVIAVVSPFVLVWQAGALLHTGERMANRVSMAQGRSRLATARDRGSTAAHGGKNFARGVRGQSAVRADGQHLLSGGSRAHTAGSRLAAGGSSLRTRLSRRTGSTEHTSDSAAADTPSRQTNFDHLRDDRNASRRSTAPSDDDERENETPPRYIH